MKFAGIAVLIASTTGIGIMLSYSAKKRVIICRELISFCNRLSVDIAFRKEPVKKLLAENGFAHLSFIKENAVMEKQHLASPLSAEENEELSRFLYSLGKTDARNQIKLIEGVRAYIENAEKVYFEKYRRDARLYITFGIFSGLIIGLIAI